MAAEQADSLPHVVVASDATNAELIIPADSDRQLVTASFCSGVLQQAGVEVTDQVMQRVEALVNLAVASAGVQRAVVAEAVPARPGKDGFIQWQVDNQEPDAVAEPAEDGAEPADKDQVDHYNRSAFRMVEAGRVIGQVVPPTTGEDGRDVFGRTIPAKWGKEAKLQHDESVMRDAAGNLIAQQEGVLVRRDGKVTIRQVLEVNDNVDFSTGNIDFKGDVIVHRGIKDKFHLKAQGNIEVRGLIEAADVEAGGDFDAQGGMAGRELGGVTVGGNMHARYLDNVHGEIQGNLAVDREMINCRLTVHGNVEADHGAIIGGTMNATGAVKVSTVGSQAGVNTELVLGSVPKMEPHAERLQTIVEKLQKRQEDLMAEEKQIKTMSRKPTAQDRERQTEIMFELASLGEKLSEGQLAHEAVQGYLDEHRTLDLTVERRLFNGVSLRVGSRRYLFKDPHRGPLRVKFDQQREVVVQIGETASPQSLARVAQVTACDNNMAKAA